MLRVMQSVIELVMHEAASRHGAGQRMRRQVLRLRLKDGPRGHRMVFGRRTDVVGVLIRNNGRVHVRQVPQEWKMTMLGTTCHVAGVCESAAASAAATGACYRRHTA